MAADGKAPSEKALIQSEKDIDILAKQMLNIGEAMHRAGSEISRTEETLYLLGKAYGALHMNVYVIPSMILLTLEFSGFAAITQERRVNAESTDLKRLGELNALCRACAKAPLPVEELRRRVLAILDEKPRSWALLIGQVLACGFFCLFFGGTLFDACAAGGIAVLIWLMGRYLAPLCSGPIFYNVLAAFFTGSAVCLGARVFPSLRTDEIIIGDIMVLIPGIAITNSVRYAISENPISGVEKLIQSLLQAGALAAGFALALYLCGKGTSFDGSVTPMAQIAYATVATYGFCLIFHIDWKSALCGALGGGICWGLYLLFVRVGLSIFWATFFSAACIGLYGELLARLLKQPTTVFFVPGCIPLIPGSNLYYMLSGMIGRDWALCNEQGTLLLLYLLGISLGLAAVLEFASIFRKLRIRIQEKAVRPPSTWK